MKSLPKRDGGSKDGKRHQRGPVQRRAEADPFEKLVGLVDALASATTTIERSGQRRELGRFVGRLSKRELTHLQKAWRTLPEGPVEDDDPEPRTWRTLGGGGDEPRPSRRRILGALSEINGADALREALFESKAAMEDELPDLRTGPPAVTADDLRLMAREFQPDIERMKAAGYSAAELMPSDDEDYAAIAASTNRGSKWDAAFDAIRPEIVAAEDRRHEKKLRLLVTDALKQLGDLDAAAREVAWRLGMIEAERAKVSRWAWLNTPEGNAWHSDASRAAIEKTRTGSGQIPPQPDVSLGWSAFGEELRDVARKAAVVAKDMRVLKSQLDRSSGGQPKEEVHAAAKKLRALDVKPVLVGEALDRSGIVDYTTVETEKRKHASNYLRGPEPASVDLSNAKPGPRRK